MSEKLQGLLLGYIKENNAELLFQLERDDALHEWVMEKIREIELVLNDSRPTDTAFMEVFSANLNPSRFRYVRDLFETEFTDLYERMGDAGTLQYELLNIVSACRFLFDDMPLVEGMENPHLDHAIVNIIADYLQVSYE